MNNSTKTNIQNTTSATRIDDRNRELNFRGLRVWDIDEEYLDGSVVIKDRSGKVLFTQVIR